MRIFSLNAPQVVSGKKGLEYFLISVILCLLWYSAPKLFSLPNGNSEEIATSVGLMVLLSIISFSMLVALCWYALGRFWQQTGLPGLENMVLRFETLELWEQLKFALCLFALLLLAGVGTLIAVL